MNNTRIASEARETALRLEEIIHLAVANHGEDCTDRLRAFYEHDVQGDTTRLFGFDDSEQDLEAFLEHLASRGYDGFLVRAAAPVRRYAGNCATGLLSYFRTRWIYAESYDDALRKAFAWAVEKEAA